MPRKAKEEIKQKPVKSTTKSTTKATKSKKVDKVTSKAKVSGTSTNKESTKKGTPKKYDTKKSTTVKKNTASKKTKTNSRSKSKKNEPVSIIEYYDLPYRYNQTIVKILAQTPQMLFVYWDIADSDKKAYEERFGSDFFNKTKPVLIVHNQTMNYSFEIEINDFANSWYLHVNDTNCKYEIELGRRPFAHVPTIKEDYIYITSSNKMDTPNNHILFEKFNPNVIYKNTKTGATSKRDFSTLANYKNMQEIYGIYDLYKQIYNDDIFKELSENSLLNPSSMSSSFMENSRS